MKKSSKIEFNAKKEISDFPVSSWHFVSFGGGRRWQPALRRISSQAARTKLFSKVNTFNNAEIEAAIQEFGRHAKFVQENPRGYGYWIWKPHIILKIFEKYPECAGIFYLDAGSEININDFSLTRLRDYIGIAERHDGLAFTIPFIEKNWTHPSLIDALGARDFAETQQIAGGILFITNSKSNIAILNKWKIWAEADDYKFLTGRFPDSIPEDLVEHRHDQSILSLLWKTAGKTSIPDESFWAPNWPQSGAKYPIWTTRSQLRLSINANPILMLTYRLARRTLITLSRSKLFI